MRKLTLFCAFSLLFTLSCNKSSKTDDVSLQADEPVAITQRSCASNDVLNEQLKADPSLQNRMDDIERFTRRIVSNPGEAARLMPDGTIEIPVVVNVIYRSSAENISLAQIQSQIDVLNEDFAAANADYSNTPSLFQGVRSGNINVHFVLDKIVRKSTTKRSWGTNDAMKKSPAGIPPTNPSTELNLWSCNMGGGILGYAQFPGGSPATDGVVIDDNAFGRTGTVKAPYHKGRTATHEVGHWMNLRHIWGDANCGNDQVDDTPQANTANYGCPAYPHYSTCSGNPVEMTMNYMDYTDDACMFMFSAGQKTRMLAVFATGGPRASFAQ